MYASAMEFLEEEHDAWAPFEALIDLTDEDLDRARAGDDATHGWSARDLLGHLVAWQEHALAVARELAVGTSSPAKERADAEWELRGDAINAELTAAWRALDLGEVRRRARSVPGELRGTLTVVPETRWVKDADMLTFFNEETIEHYQRHRDELAAIMSDRD
ncbi:MAG: DinB family protein [Candidatus Limnocylindrales bacterium]